MKRLLALTGLAIALSVPAAAGNTGCYVGGAVGASWVNNEVSVNNLAKVDGFGSNGWQGGGVLGCDLAIAQTAFIGAFGNYDWLNNEFSITSPVLGLGIADISYENEWSLGVRGGFNLSDATSIYGLVAYSELQPSDLTLLGKSFDVGSFSGYAVGGGIQTALAYNWSLGLEYRHTMYDEQTVVLNKWVSLDLDPTHDSVRTTLTYKFGGVPEAEKLVPLK